MHPIYEQNRRLRECENELERQERLYKATYENAIKSRQTYSPDFGELMQYLRQLRGVLQEQVSAITKAKKEHSTRESSVLEKHGRYLRFQNRHELTEEIVAEIVERIYIDVDGVRIVDVYSVAS